MRTQPRYCPLSPIIGASGKAMFESISPLQNSCASLLDCVQYVHLSKTGGRQKLSGV